LPMLKEMFRRAGCYETAGGLRVCGFAVVRRSGRSCAGNILERSRSCKHSHSRAKGRLRLPAIQAFMNIPCLDVCLILAGRVVDDVCSRPFESRTPKKTSIRSRREFWTFEHVSTRKPLGSANYSQRVTCKETTLEPLWLKEPHTLH